MKRSTAAFLLLSLPALCVGLAPGEGARSPRPAGRPAPAEAPGGDRAAAQPAGVRLAIPPESLKALIDRLEQGENLSSVDLPDGEFKKLVADIVRWQAPPAYKPPRVKGSIDIDQAGTRLEAQAIAIAQDLTTWDRLLTAIDRPTADAVRYTDPRSPAPDSTKHLRTRLALLAKGIDERPNFRSDERDLEKYVGRKPRGKGPDNGNGDPAEGAGPGGFPQADGYLTQGGGDVTASVGNGPRLRTLDLRLALLRRVRGPKASDEASHEPTTRTAARGAVIKLSQVPTNESKEKKDKREHDLVEARRKLRALFSEEIADATKAALKDRPEKPQNPGDK